jgi:outer membrane lipoprotein carrier protein
MMNMRRYSDVRVKAGAGRRVPGRRAAAVLLAAAVVFSAPLCRAADRLDECIRCVEQKYAAMQDLSARFEQETYLGSLQRVEKGSGTVCFKKGGKMYWEYKKPSVQKIYLDGKNLWFYLPEEHQAMKNDASRLPSDITGELFAGTLKIRDKFNVCLAAADEPAGKKNITVLKLTPITARPNMKSLTLQVDMDSCYIIRSSLEDELGNITTLTFSKIKADRGLKDSLFMFTPPRGVDIFEPPAIPSANPAP